jgi:hypothetical protein
MDRLTPYPTTPREIRAALEYRQLSQQALARLAGVDPRTARRWCDTRPGDDRRLTPGAIALICIALQKHDQENPAQPASNRHLPNTACDAPDNPHPELNK